MCIYIYIHTCTCVYIYIYIYTYIHTYIYVYIYIYMCSVVHQFFSTCFRSCLCLQKNTPPEENYVRKIGFWSTKSGAG